MKNKWPSQPLAFVSRVVTAIVIIKDVCYL